MPRVEDVTGRAKSLNQMSDCERTRQYEVLCRCGTTFLARFYEQQSPSTNAVILLGNEDAASQAVASGSVPSEAQ